jgi:chaperonin GroEL
LVKNSQAKTIEAAAVRTPGVLEMDRVAAMEDIAILTGGRIFYSVAHSDFHGFQVADLGRARRAWATDSLFGIFGWKGDPRRVRQHILAIRGMLKSAEGEHEKKVLQERLGRLAGGTAILRVGGATDTETEARQTMADRAVTGLRKAIAGGVVPGGGTALLNAQGTLATLPARNEDEAIAYKILSRALEEPMRTIVKNAGYQPDVILEKVKQAPPGSGFDAHSGRIVDMKQIGVLDAVLVLEKALEIAVSGAASALTTDVIVHHRKPQECIEP